MAPDNRVLVIGLDCAAPDLVFRQFKGRLPNLEKLMSGGTYGELETCNPPITIPAWMVMFTGRSPGELGLYGFRHRAPGTYDDIWIANSGKISSPTVWDLAGAKGKHCTVMAVPPSYPPYPVNGELIGCFLTTDVEKSFTYPEGLRIELEEQELPYVPDVEFRVEDKETLLEGIYDMTGKRFDIAGYLMEDRDWDLFVMVEIGLDRMHHAFWKYHDPEHHLYEPGLPLENAIPEYYEFLDQRVGELLEKAGDETSVLVVSDHGAKRMKGAFCINQWLVDKGYLKLLEQPEGVISLDDARVDWSRTSAWAWGGYYSRVFINVKGREPQGFIEPDRYEEFRDKLTREIEAITGPEGEALDNRVWTPGELYDEVNGDPPDLMVCLDDLSWRPAGTLGHSSTYLPENDTGPDDAVHDWKGTYILNKPGEGGGGRKSASIYQVAPTILSCLGMELPKYMKAESIGRDD